MARINKSASDNCHSFVVRICDTNVVIQFHLDSIDFTRALRQQEECDCNLIWEQY